MMSLWTILWTTILLYAGISFYRFWRTVGRFKDHNIPFEQPWWLLGNMWKPLFRIKHFFFVLQDTYNLSPSAKYVGIFDFAYPVVMIRDPDLIRSIGVRNAEKFPDHRGFVDEKLDPLFGRILFSMKGTKWHDARTLLSPAFTSSKMKTMFESMNECAENFSDFILEQSKRGFGEVELKDLFSRLTNDVIATCAFGIRVDSVRDRKNDFYVRGRKATDFDGLLSLKYFFLRSFPMISNLFRIRLVDEETHKFFTRVISEIVADRDKQKITHPDMLQLMMDSRGKANSLDMDMIIVQVFGLFFGGFETTSTLMSFVGHLIATNPDVQKRLQAEVDEVWEKTNGKLTYDVLNDMKYLDAVINETLRMYPPAQFMDRVCESEFELPPCLPGQSSFTLKPGDQVWFPIHALLHDPQYFENPDKFDPERFYQKQVTVSHKTFIPFGLGPRMCIGTRFALQETKTVFFNLLFRCNFKICSKTKEPMEFSKSSFVMLAKGGFWIELEPREHVVSSLPTYGSVTA